MVQVPHRPAGILVIALALVLAGLASLVESAQLIVDATGGWPHAVLAAVIGLGLLYRAFNLWQLTRGAWLVTTLLLLLKTAATGAEIISGQAVSVGWLALETQPKSLAGLADM